MSKSHGKIYEREKSRGHEKKLRMKLEGQESAPTTAWLVSWPNYTAKAHLHNGRQNVNAVMVVKNLMNNL